jgi:hypothetical protein
MIHDSSSESVLDPNPDPLGSRSVTYLYGFESTSFHQQAMKLRKTLISTVLGTSVCLFIVV